MSKSSNQHRRRLEQVKAMTTKAVTAAMNAASDALDGKVQEIAALKRILISERAQVIYYTDKYLKFVSHECMDLIAVGFLDLPESQQEVFVKRAVRELSGDAVAPHDHETVPEKKIIQ